MKDGRNEQKVLPLAEPQILPEYALAVARQIDTGFIGPGAATNEFAEALEEYLGVAHCVPTVSGTVALSVAARALGLRPGDEILVPAYGVISTINAFASMGLRPRLVDIDCRTGCMDPQKLQDALQPQTRAVCFVNFSGRTGPELLEIAGVCGARSLPLIEDAACALGHRFDNRAAGSFGTAGTLSFSVPKVVTTGQGGAVLVESEAHRDAAIRWIDHGDTEWRRTNINREIGTNLRFTDILAALGLVQLKRINELLERRRKTYGAIKELLGECLYATPGIEAPLHNIVFSPSADELASYLRKQGILAARQYRVLYQHPAYRHLAHDGSCPNAEFWTDHAVYLPFGLAMEVEDALRVGHAVRNSGHRLLTM